MLKFLLIYLTIASTGASNFIKVVTEQFPGVIMQTVITWRRPAESQRYLQYQNPCIVLFGNAVCFIIVGLLVLVVGVIITSLTFQNLEHHESETTERYAGPVLIVLGVLILARGTFSQIRPTTTPSSSSQRLLIRSYTSDLYTRPFMGFSSNSITMCAVSVADAHEYPRLSIYDDEPPSYDDVISTTPATIRYSNRRLSICTHDSFQSPDGSLEEPPPSYEEFIRTNGEICRS